MKNENEKEINDNREHRSNPNADEIPLWLQGLEEKPPEDETPSEPEDKWVKELTGETPESIQQEASEKDTGGEESKLPDWLSELSTVDPSAPIQDTQEIRVQKDTPKKKKKKKHNVVEEI